MRTNSTAVRAMADEVEGSGAASVDIGSNLVGFPFQ